MKTRGIISSLYLAKALVARLLHYLFPSFWGGSKLFASDLSIIWFLEIMKLTAVAIEVVA